MNLLDLFSGIGGFSLGLERSGGFKTVAFCEIKEFRRRILARSFPGVEIYEDVRNIKNCAFEVDVTVGGPPCQKTSIAAAIHGKRTGESLWPEMLRAGLNVGTKWFVVEQPARNKKWEAEVSGDLARAGFHSARAEFAACDLGAVNERRRVLILAHRSLSRLEGAWRSIPSKIEEVKRFAAERGDWSVDIARVLRVDARAPHRLDRRQRIEAIGDCNPPQMMEVIGRAIREAGL